MIRAAIYNRVSTEGQEQDGTSLHTQRDCCLKYCQDKYSVSQVYSEAYSGLKLDRPVLNDLRNAVRSGAVDVIVIYSLDRLTRDPGHGVIITQELDKHSVKLEAVTEDVDNSEMGKLIAYIRGFASKLEAEKIQERTTRGKRAKAELGFMSSGGHSKTYGYDYVRPDRKQTGRRVVNELEAFWVRKMYHWYTVEGLSTRGIAKRLNDARVPVKSGKHGAEWNPGHVKRILSYEAYIGKTIIYGKDIPGLTEAIIDVDTFETAQEQLKINRERALRNATHEYLLGGHLICRGCGNPAWGYTGGRSSRRYYKCSARWSSTKHSDCDSKSWFADDLESRVWSQLQGILMNPELIIAEMEKQLDTGESVALIEAELKPVVKKVKALDKEQTQLLQWAVENGFPEALVKAENQRLNDLREALNKEKTELEIRLAACHDAEINRPSTEGFINILRQKVTDLDYEGKRLALQALNIRILVDGSNIEITGSIPREAVALQNS